MAAGNEPGIHQEIGSVRNHVSLVYILDDGKKRHVLSGSVLQDGEGAMSTFSEALENLAAEYVDGTETV